MEANTYLDFDLRFTRDGDGYRAEILQSPGGVGGHSFRLPFQDVELENYLLKIGARYAGMRKAESPETKAAREFGDKLYETVFQDEVAAAWEKSVAEARAAERGLRIRLRLDATPELADLPWEYLYQAQRREFLALSKETPVVRYFDLPDKVKPLAVTPPLRVLVMLSSPADLDCLDVEKEWQKLKAAVKVLEERHLLVVERLPRATLTELLNRLRKEDYHVFHFIGHGNFDPASQASVLYLENEKGRRWEISGDDLGIYLRDEPALRLVLLNACEGARASRTDPFSGVAQSLVLKGVPAVIAMQFSVTDEAAIAMAEGFYSAVADDYPVDAALTEARKAVFAAGCTVEWGTPVLYLRAEDARIFDVTKTAAQKAEEAASPRPRVTVTPPPLPVSVVKKPVAPVRREPVTVPAPDLEKRAPRRWVWVLAGIAFTFVAFLLLGWWINSQEEKKKKQISVAEPTPARVIDSLPEELKPTPGVETNSSPATDPAALKAEIASLSKQQEEMSAKFKEYDETARNAISHIRTDSSSDDETQAQPASATTGTPAGSYFQPTGWWQMMTGPPQIARRIEFDPKGRFSGIAVDQAGQSGPVSGYWSYVPGTSLFGVTFDNGDWASLYLSVYGNGFAGYFFINGGRVDLYLEKAQ